MSFYCPASWAVCLMLSVCLVWESISSSPSKKKRMNNNKWSLKRETRVDEDELSLSLYWLFTRHLFLLGSQSEQQDEQQDEQQEAKSREGPKILLHQHHLFLMKGYRVYDSLKRRQEKLQTITVSIAISFLPLLSLLPVIGRRGVTDERNKNITSMFPSLMTQRIQHEKKWQRNITCFSPAFFVGNTFSSTFFLSQISWCLWNLFLTQTIFKMSDRFTPECLISFFPFHKIMKQIVIRVISRFTAQRVNHFRKQRKQKRMTRSDK